MSGMTCSQCGHGELDGYGWGFVGGRLAHELAAFPDEPGADATDDEWAAYAAMAKADNCRRVVDIADGLAWCSLGGHVILPRDGVLAQREVYFEPDGTARPVRIRPRTSAFERYVIHIDVMPPTGIEVPDTTRAVIYDADEHGAPYLACRECAEDQWPEGTKLIPLTRRTSSAAGASPKGGPRVAKVSPVEPDQSLPDDWATAKTICEMWKLDPDNANHNKKVRRALTTYVENGAAEVESRPTLGGGVDTNWYRKARA